MGADPRRIVVTESCCHACSVRTVHVHHLNFPEMRVEALSAEEAARHLENRLGAAIGDSPDPLRREAVRSALADARAFLDGEGYAHLGCDISTPNRS